jgi:hypothetical protein
MISVILGACVLRVCKRNQSKESLPSNEKRLGIPIVEIHGFRSQLDFFDKVLSLDGGGQQSPRTLYRLGFAVWFDGEHPDTDRLML